MGRSAHLRRCEHLNLRVRRRKHCFWVAVELWCTDCCGSEEKASAAAFREPGTSRKQKEESKFHRCLRCFLLLASAPSPRNGWVRRWGICRFCGVEKLAAGGVPLSLNFSSMSNTCYGAPATEIVAFEDMFIG
nr:hypothetical protein Itr_chr08CG11880 [Ipomoea trifida]